MAYTLAQIERLERAIASGVTTVRSSDGTLTTYQSTSDMQKALSQMRTEYNTSSGAARKRRQTKIYAVKNL